MVAKSVHILEIDGEFIRDLKNYAIVATPQYDCSINNASNDANPKSM
jgi:hypothetical protein